MEFTNRQTDVSWIFKDQKHGNELSKLTLLFTGINPFSIFLSLTCSPPPPSSPPLSETETSVLPHFPKYYCFSRERKGVIVDTKINKFSNQHVSTS